MNSITVSKSSLRPAMHRGTIHQRQMLTILWTDDPSIAGSSGLPYTNVRQLGSILLFRNLLRQEGQRRNRQANALQCRHKRLCSAMSSR